MPLDGLVTAKLVDALRASNNFARKNQAWPRQNDLHKYSVLTGEITDCGEVQLSRRGAEDMRRLAGVRL
ncbi:hypothetical protein MNBD_NITROSPINAE01-254 [hydrothermal vent metagenome]|uniref:Uncharacterized protein n=1 Tax=hydrothermal vent metagenome TaxID=652676 RepID=A0A3B1CNG2_9ZZZZ